MGRLRLPSIQTTDIQSLTHRSRSGLRPRKSVTAGYGLHFPSTHTGPPGKGPRGTSAPSPGSAQKCTGRFNLNFPKRLFWCKNWQSVSVENFAMYGSKKNKSDLFSTVACLFSTTSDLIFSKSLIVFHRNRH